MTAIILCDDVLGVIFNFLRPQDKVFLNHDYYKKYHSALIIPRYDSFLRNIIRKDYHLIFERHLSQRYDGWWRLKQWIYKDMKFYNYVEYLRWFSLNHNCQKCRSVIENMIHQKQSYAKKKYKKVRIRNTGKWNN